MGDLLEGIFYLIHLWRIALGAVIGCLIACVLGLLIPSWAASSWHALAFGGASCGFVWQIAVASAREAAAGRRIERMSAPIAFLGMATLGGIWGWGMASATNATAAVICLLVAPWILGALFGSISRRRVTPKDMAWATVASLVGFSTPHAIRFIFALAGA